MKIARAIFLLITSGSKWVSTSIFPVWLAYFFVRGNSVTYISLFICELSMAAVLLQCYVTENENTQNDSNQWNQKQFEMNKKINMQIKKEKEK